VAESNRCRSGIVWKEKKIAKSRLEIADFSAMMLQPCAMTNCGSLLAERIFQLLIAVVIKAEHRRARRSLIKLEIVGRLDKTLGPASS